MLARHGTSLFIALVLFCSTAKAVALTGLAPTAKAAESRQMMRAEDEVAMLIQSDGKVKAMENAKTSSTDQQLPAQMPIRAQAAPVIYAAPVASASTAAFPGVQVVAGPSPMAGQSQYTVPTVQSQQANGWQPQYIAAPAKNGDLPYASVYSAPTVAMPSNVAASSMQSMPQIPASSVRAQLQNIPPVWGTLAPPSQTAPIPQQVVPSRPSAAQPPQSAVAPAAPPKVAAAAVAPAAPPKVIEAAKVVVQPAALKAPIHIVQPPQPAPAAHAAAPIPPATPASQPKPPQPTVSPAAPPLPVAPQGASPPQRAVTAPVAPHSAQPAAAAPPAQPVSPSPQNSGFGYPVPAQTPATTAHPTPTVSESKSATPTERHTVFMVLIGSINVVLVVLFLRSSPATTKAINSYMSSVLCQSQTPVEQIPEETLHDSKFKKPVPVFKTEREEYDESSVTSMSADEAYY